MRYLLIAKEGDDAVLPLYLMIIGALAVLLAFTLPTIIRDWRARRKEPRP